jgi:hypothetical protein
VVPQELRHVLRFGHNVPAPISALIAAFLLPAFACTAIAQRIQFTLCPSEEPDCHPVRILCSLFRAKPLARKRAMQRGSVTCIQEQ